MKEREARFQRGILHSVVGGGIRGSPSKGILHPSECDVDSRRHTDPQPRPKVLGARYARLASSDWSRPAERVGRRSPPCCSSAAPRRSHARRRVRRFRVGDRRTGPVVGGGQHRITGFGSLRIQEHLVEDGGGTRRRTRGLDARHARERTIETSHEMEAITEAHEDGRIERCRRRGWRRIIRLKRKNRRLFSLSLSLIARGPFPLFDLHVSFARSVGHWTEPTSVHPATSGLRFEHEYDDAFVYRTRRRSSSICDGGESKDPMFARFTSSNQSFLCDLSRLGEEASTCQP